MSARASHTAPLDPVTASRGRVHARDCLPFLTTSQGRPLARAAPPHVQYMNQCHHFPQRIQVHGAELAPTRDSKLQGEPERVV